MQLASLSLSMLSKQTLPMVFAYPLIFDELHVAISYSVFASTADHIGAGGQTKGHAAAPPPPPTKADKPSKAKADDDDMDLFGDDEDEAPAPAPAQSRAEKFAAMKAEKEGKDKAKKKKDKSQIVLEIKPVDTEVNLDELYAKIKEAIQPPGLTWGEAWNKVPVAFGIYKLVVSFVIFDEDVSVDDVTEKIESMEEEVQSVDIASFNKL